MGKTALAQGRGHVLQIQQRLHHRPGLARCVSFARQDIRHLGVSETAGGAYQGIVEFTGQYLAFVGNLHAAGQGQTVHIGPQRTQVVGQHFRQHGHHAAGQIHRIAALLRIFIQRAGLLQIMGNIGDGNFQQPAASGFFRIYCVVEVLGVFAVDGHQRQMREIFPPRRQFYFCPGQSFGLFQRGFRPVHGNVILAQGDIGDDAGIVGIAHDLDNLAAHAAALAGVLRNTRHHGVAVFHISRNTVEKQRLGNAWIIRNHFPATVIRLIAADDLRRAALEHLHQTAFSLAFITSTGNAHFDAVAMQGFAHGAASEEHIFAVFIGHQKAETVAMADDATGNSGHFAHGRQLALFSALELTITNHRIDAFVKAIKISLAGHFQTGSDLFKSLCTLLSQEGQDNITARNRVLVAPGLFFLFRIGIKNWSFLR